MRLLSAGPPSQSWPIGLQENNNKFQESCLWANQHLVKNKKLPKAQNLNIDTKSFSRKQIVSPNCVCIFEKKLFFCSKLTPRRHICLTQAVIAIMSSTSNFFATMAALCNKHATSSLKCGQLCLGGPGKMSHIVTFHPMPQIKLSNLDHEIFKGTYLNRVTVREWTQFSAYRDLPSIGCLVRIWTGPLAREWILSSTICFKRW